jgi:hypothetical protein
LVSIRVIPVVILTFGAQFIHLGSTTPFQISDNHNQTYRSGMLQSWNKFCFTSGYIEVAVTLPGPDENTMGYVSFDSFLFSSRFRRPWLDGVAML